MTLIDFDENGFPTPPYENATKIAIAYLVNRYNLNYIQDNDFWIKNTAPESRIRLSQKALISQLHIDDLGVRFYTREWCKMKKMPLFSDSVGGWWIMDNETNYAIEADIRQNVLTFIQSAILMIPSSPSSLDGTSLALVNPLEVDCYEKTWSFFTRFLQQYPSIRDKILIRSLFGYFFTLVIKHFKANRIPHLIRLTQAEFGDLEQLQIHVPEKTYDRIKLENIITPRDLGVVISLYCKYHTQNLEKLLKKQGFSSIADFKKKYQPSSKKDNEILLLHIRDNEKAQEYAALLGQSTETWSTYKISMYLSDLKGILQYIIPKLANEILPICDEYHNLIQQIATSETLPAEQSFTIERSFEAFALLTRTFELIDQ
jgi:hypothetical protein